MDLIDSSRWQAGEAFFSVIYLHDLHTSLGSWLLLAYPDQAHSYPPSTSACLICFPVFFATNTQPSMSYGSQSTRISRICGYCRTGRFRKADCEITRLKGPKGISPTEAFSECTYCRLSFCRECDIEHEPSHEPALITVNVDQRDAYVHPVREDCARCSKPALSRYWCEECTYSLCRDCWFDKGFNKHKHKQFKVIEARSRIDRSSDRSLDQYCCQKASFYHCSSCTLRK